MRELTTNEKIIVDVYEAIGNPFVLVKQAGGSWVIETPEEDIVFNTTDEMMDNIREHLNAIPTQSWEGNYRELHKLSLVQNVEYYTGQIAWYDDLIKDENDHIKWCREHGYRKWEREAIQHRSWGYRGRARDRKSLAYWQRELNQYA